MREVLETNASQSKTTQLWVENLVKLIFIMMLFVRAEREADWPLHLWAVKEMLRISSLQDIVTMRGMLHTTYYKNSVPMLHERGTCDAA